MARRTRIVGTVTFTAWLAVSCGAEPADRSTTTSVAPPPAEPSDPIATVCADPDCGGAEAAVREWRDDSGAIQRLELVDSPRCPHSAGRFYDASGAPTAIVPRPFLGPGTQEEERALADLHALERRGLTEGARIPCAPRSR